MSKLFIWFGLASGNFLYAFAISNNFEHAISWTVAQGVAIGTVALVQG
jgi:hypothetical protein